MAGKEVQTLGGRSEIPIVSGELYAQTREALAKEGYTFVVAIESLSIRQLVTDKATGQRFDSINLPEDMYGIVPPQMEVAINLKNLRIKNSNSSSADGQKMIIEKEEAALKSKLPQEVRGLISMRRQTPSVLAQLDIAHQEKTGRVFFANWFGSTSDQIVPDFVTGVGRDAPTSGLAISVWLHVYRDKHVFAVPVVVLPRVFPKKLAA